MRKPIVFLTLILALSVPTIQPAGAAAVYRSGEGWSADDEDSGPVEDSASAQLRKAEGLEAQGEQKKALGAYKNLIRQWPDSGAGPKAQLKIGDLYLALGDPEKAFKAYGKYLSTYPQGQDFEKAVESQFRIAMSFLDGERRKVFGIKTFPSMQRAQEMFGEIIKNAPFSKWAPLAQFNIGRALEKQTKYDEAIAAYQKTVEKYPADEISADAQYQVGYIYLSLSREGSNDQGARQKAREAFEDFIMRYPQSEKVAQANENLTHLTGTDTKKTLGVAQFYERTKNYKAAVIYYEEVIQNSPNTPEAEIAKKRMEHLTSTQGEDALRAGPERAETGAKAKERRKLQSLVDTASRPDYVGPPAPAVPDEVVPPKPQLRAPGGAVEPALPTGPLPAEPQTVLPSE